MERKHVILLTVIAVATLLTAMVGSTFAYFTASVSGAGSNKPVDVTTAQVKATYSDGSKISVENIAPGWKATKEISITNNTDTNFDNLADIEYTIKFLGEEDELVTEGEATAYSNEFDNLQYTLTADASNNDKKYGSSVEGIKAEMTTMGKSYLNDQDSSNILVSGKLAKGETHQFVLTIEFKDTLAVQEEQGKTFTGKLYVEANTVKPQ